MTAKEIVKSIEPEDGWCNSATGEEFESAADGFLRAGLPESTVVSIMESTVAAILVAGEVKDPPVCCEACGGSKGAAWKKTTDEERKMLLASYEHRDADEMLRSLELVLEMYARPGNWCEERHGDPPHYLRKGMMLNFDPANTVDGYRFAEEALAALDRFRERKLKEGR